MSTEAAAGGDTPAGAEAAEAAWSLAHAGVLRDLVDAGAAWAPRPPTAADSGDVLARLREAVADVERWRSRLPVLVGPAAVLDVVMAEFPWYPSERLVSSTVTDGKLLVVAPHLMPGLIARGAFVPGGAG